MSMNVQSDEIFQSTLSGLEAGLRVRHIATFGLVTCDASERVVDVFQKPGLNSLDQLPVVSKGSVVGVLERTANMPSALAIDAMRPLDESILVSGDEPLSTFLLQTFEGSYRLVIDGVRINGIVTWSDVLKLPVRLLAFTLITHLEALMTTYISRRCPNEDDWFSLLPKGRQTKLLKEMKARREQNLDPFILDMTHISDKATVIRKLLGLTNKFTTDMGRVKDLRDAVAHARDYAEDEISLERFRKHLRTTHTWIVELTEHLNEISPSHIINADTHNEVAR